ncbi:hypothetical protein GCM10011386_41140 [Parapedobacter defluvii]|uniref:Uncharacterized protein n=2 Tax=Parapedobacter defluvii TaxID=2045106 RepID=A0ABQ1MPX3_9SPHI|nr:hypothetical protein GCM10011386_41140 [Parapedobacter defluvii]
MTMNNIESYPIFEADQVLTNNHLNDTVSYLERQGRLSRIRLIGNGIVSGLEITASGEGIVIGEGHGITSQGYLIRHCQQEYTHYIDFVSPDIPTGVDFIVGCDEDEASGWPYYGMEGIFELVPAASPAEGKKAVSSLKKDEYVVVLLLEAKQVKLKNCDTNDCNDKGSRLDFTVKPLLVHIDLLKGDDESFFNTLLLKRYGVPANNRWESGESILNGFYELVDDDTLTKLEQNLKMCWNRYAVLLELTPSNPFEKLDLKALRDKFSYQKGNFHYIQYFYDFIDDLIKAFREFDEKAQDFWGMRNANETHFPLHLTLGLASESTRFGYWDPYRQYFVPVHYLHGQQHLKEEVALLLQRMRYMIADFDDTLPSKNQVLQITPSQIGANLLSDRSIPFYYQLNNLHKWWNYRLSRMGIPQMNRGYHLRAGIDAPEAVKNVLLYDNERFNAFRIEGHVGKPYSTALSEIIAERDKYNLPFDVVALSAVDLERIADGNEVSCQVQDLESNYNVMIAGLLCRVEQLLTYVGGLRPKKDTDIGDIRVIDTLKVSDELSLPTLSKKVTAIRKEVDLQKKVTTQPVVEKVNYIEKIVDLGKDDQEVKLMDFVAKDINSFLVTDRKLFEYVLPKPDLLLVFLQRLNAIFGYLFENDLREFDVDAYNKLWAEYESTVNSIIKESANSQNEELKAYFAPKNNNVLFNCANEELYAIKEEYNERLKQYQEATTFARYFERHKGLEHKAGVPKGGTFVLVYQPSAPRYTAVIPEKEIRLVDRLTDVVKEEPAETITKKDTGRLLKDTKSASLLSSATVKYADTVSLIEKLGLGADATKVLDALKKREEAEKLVSKLPGGVVIADFYVPYLVKSNCQPIAYVFQKDVEVEPSQPEEPEEPEDDQLAVTIEPTTFCTNDTQEYSIKVSPEGGKLTLNGKESEAKIVPARLGKGTFEVVYTLASGTKASTQFAVEEAVEPDFEVVGADYSEKDENWKLMLKSAVSSGDSLKSQWLLDGKSVAENQSEISQILTVNNPRATIAYSVTGRVCGKGEKTRTFVRDEQAKTVCSDAATLTIPVKTSGTVVVVAAPKGVTTKGTGLIISPAQMTKDGLKQGVIAYHYADGDAHVLAVLTITLGTAAFEATIGLPQSDVVVIGREVKNAVSIALKAISTGGISTWTVNGKKAKETVSIPLAEFEQLKELTITHQIDFGDGPCGAEKTFTQPIAALRKQLATNKGKIVVE